MLRVTLWHEPEYFGFYIKDPGAEISMGPSEATEVEQHRFAARQGIVTVGVKSEYTTIPITVEFDQLGAEPPESALVPKAPVPGRSVTVQVIGKVALLPPLVTVTTAL